MMNPVIQLLDTVKRVVQNRDLDREVKRRLGTDRNDITISHDEAVALTEQLIGPQGKQAHLAIVHIPCTDKDVSFWFVSLSEPGHASVFSEAMYSLEEKLPPGSSLDVVATVNVCRPPLFTSRLVTPEEMERRSEELRAKNDPHSTVHYKTICAFDLFDYLEDVHDTLEVQCLHSNGSLNRVIEIPIDRLPFAEVGPYPFFKILLRGQRSQENDS
jgi:hypothetical protein